MAELKRDVAGYLLQSKAIILEPTKPFVWASGWHAPIYCDNRVTLSFPEIRRAIRDAFVAAIRSHFPQSELVAGVATGAIAQGALVAEAMDQPFVYVRASAKEHGRKNLVEGRLEPGKKVVVVEDLVSTGGSSLKAVQALREAGATVEGMVAIFSYGFDQATVNFAEADLPLVTLTDYATLIEMAMETGYVGQDHQALLQEWRKNPSAWKYEN